MYTFLIGIVILIVGGPIYAFVLQKIFKANSRYKTIAFTKQDNVDFTPMNKWKNAFVQFKSIAATGPVMGPIQGIIFGPIVFLTIPIGNLVGGIIHDTYSGLISMRNGGAQNPEWIRRYIGRVCQIILLILTVFLAVVVGAVFITMPTQLIVGDIQHQPTMGSSYTGNWLLWVMVLLILGYYVIATILPFDKIIGKVYPTLSVILAISTILIFIGACTHNPSTIPEIWSKLPPGYVPLGSGHFIPLICVTITCGMISGYHSTQSTIIGRAVKNEKETYITFSLPMIVEGLFAMSWAFVALCLCSKGDASSYVHTATTRPSEIIGDAATAFMWGQQWLVIFIVLVACMEAITVGDTALRSSRLILAEFFKVDQKKISKRLLVSSGCFAATIGLMFIAIFDPYGFNYLWKEFAWADQSTIAFVFAAIVIYMIRKRLFYWVALIPGSFYAFISVCFVLGSDKQGINALVPSDYQAIGWTVAYVIGGLTALAFIIVLLWYGHKTKDKPHVWIEEKQIMFNKKHIT